MDLAAPTPSAAAATERLLAIMARLRAPNGCPWDHAQTLATLKQNLVEEAYEVLDAIDSGDRRKLEEELGDLLLQVVFQAQLCREEGAFDFAAVANHIADKLIRRHPHVFGDRKAAGADEALQNWDAVKRTEKGGDFKSTLDGIPRHLPALHKAHQVQKRAARLGFDWRQADEVLAKIDEELGEVRAALLAGEKSAIREEIGDLIFSVVNLSRFLGHNAEEVLNDNIAKFSRRFREIERQVHAGGKTVADCPLAELEELWTRVKAAE